MPGTQKALEAAALAQEVGSVSQVLLHLALAMFCLYHRGQFHEALRIAQRAEQMGRMPSGLHLPMMRTVFYYQALVLLEWNRLDDALDLARRAIELREHTGLIGMYAYIAYTVLLKVELALTLLVPMLEEATNRHWGKLIIELLILQALAQQLRQEEQAANSALAQAVRLAEPEGYIRSFVDEGPQIMMLLSRLQEQERKLGPTPYLNTLLAAFPNEERPHKSHPEPASQGVRHLAPQPLLDPLSERELEVLRLLARGASNQEIAESLVVAVNTVKHHVSSILSKLGVSNRTHAVLHTQDHLT